MQRERAKSSIVYLSPATSVHVRTEDLLPDRTPAHMEKALDDQTPEDLSVRVVDAQFACEIDSIFQVCVTRHLQHRDFQQPAHLLGLM
jgi:hypothetical protein